MNRSLFKVLVINYEPYIKENKADTIREICHASGITAVEMTYNREEPSGFGDRLTAQLQNHQGRIFVDVSAMSRLLIIQILVALGVRSEGFAKCFVAYSEALTYPPSEAEAKMKLDQSEGDPTFSVFFLSSGVFEITVLPELSSHAPAGGQTRLIAFPSFDAHQLTALRVELQPSRISVIEGVPPTQANRWRQKLISDANRLDQIQDIESCQTSTIDYQETLVCLLKFYSRHSVRERLLISPTGSKMQTVAVGIFRAFIEDVAIIYPTPTSFLKPDSYTIGVGPTYVLPLEDFGVPHRHTDASG